MNRFEEQVDCSRHIPTCAAKESGRFRRRNVTYVHDLPDLMHATCCVPQRSTKGTIMGGLPLSSLLALQITVHLVTVCLSI